MRPDNPDSPTKVRLIAEMYTAKRELQRTKVLLNEAAVKAQTVDSDQPDGVPALTLATDEYDSAMNQYHTAVSNFADFILEHAIS